ncbi:MAG: hypothetical protein ACRDKG_07090 [Actinomycetota bacterium]
MTDHEGTNPFQMPPAPLPEETLIVSPGPKRRPAAYLAVLIGLVAMAGGAVFFARSLGSVEGGADTPVAAVQRLFDALGNEDALGMLETLLPSERDSLSGPIQDVTRELGRLGILSEDVDLGSIQGIELDFSGLTFSAKDVASGVSVVTLDAGSSTYTVDPARSPLGDFVRGLMPEEANEVIKGSDDLSDEDIAIATIKEGDKWFVSLWYSVAEGARTSLGAPVPPFGNGIVARGEATPEAAVEAFIRSAVLLEVRRLIELTPPEEARALHDYAPLFIDAAESGAREARKHYSAEVSVLKLAGSQTGDRAIVKVDELEFSFSIPELGIAAEYDGQCVTIRGGDFFGSDTPQRQCGTGLGAIPVPGFPQLQQPEIGFVAVREGGEWFVSPTATIFDGLIATLKGLDRNALEMFVQIFGGLSGG